MGIWADHLHPKVWLEWEVLGWIIGIVFAIGGIVLVFDQYLIANVCFGIVTILICVKVCQIAILSKTEKLASRMLFVLFICSLTIFALTETVGGVNRYKSRKKLEATRPVSEPVTEKSKSLPTPNNPQPSTAETAKGTYPSPKQRRSRSGPPAVAVPAPAPDVTLKFVYRESPALVIVNSSDAVARDMKWMVVLWNRDHPDDANPLQIPATAFDWLKPHTMSAPNGFLSLPAVVPKIKPGDHLIGSAAVDCPTCKRGRTYFVSIVVGQGGWFAEITEVETGGPLIPKNFLPANRDLYFQTINATAEASRTPIE